MSKRKITLYIQSGKKTVDLDEPLLTTHGSTMELKNVSVFWFSHNLLKDVTAKYGSKKFTFNKGYWSFDQIKNKLAEHDIELKANVFNNTCTITTKQNLRLYEVGTLLGFDASTIIHTGANQTGTGKVDINRGLRYLTISCDIVNSLKNTNTDGKRSNVLATLPITSEQNLHSSVSYYKDVASKVVIDNGYFNKLDFNVSSNIGPVNVDLLLELYVST